MHRLSEKEIIDIYKNGIKKDFPPAERKPLFIIQWALAKKYYSAYAIKNENGVQAYATFLGGANSDVLLLDYFAVKASQRGTGVGSGFIHELVETLQVRGLFLECESPESARNLKERAERIKRIDFYLKNGAVLTETLLTVASVQYRVMWLPINGKLKNLNASKEVKEIYAGAPPNFFYKHMVKAQHAKNGWR